MYFLDIYNLSAASECSIFSNRNKALCMSLASAPVRILPWITMSMGDFKKADLKLASITFTVYLKHKTSTVAEEVCITISPRIYGALKLYSECHKQFFRHINAGDYKNIPFFPTSQGMMLSNASNIVGDMAKQKCGRNYTNNNFRKFHSTSNMKRGEDVSKMDKAMLHTKPTAFKIYQHVGENTAFIGM